MRETKKSKKIIHIYSNGADRLFEEKPLKNIDRIVTYCEKDVIAVAQLILKFRQEKLLEEHELIAV